jgi:hypothetical protein
MAYVPEFCFTFLCILTLGTQVRAPCGGRVESKRDLRASALFLLPGNYDDYNSRVWLYWIDDTFITVIASTKYCCPFVAIFGRAGYAVRLLSYRIISAANYSLPWLDGNF